MVTKSSKKSNLSEQNKNISDFGLLVYRKIKLFVEKNQPDLVSKYKLISEVIEKYKSKKLRLSALNEKAEPEIKKLEITLDKLKNENSQLLSTIKKKLEK